MHFLAGSAGPELAGQPFQGLVRWIFSAGRRPVGSGCVLSHPKLASRSTALVALLGVRSSDWRAKSVADVDSAETCPTWTPLGRPAIPRPALPRQRGRAMVCPTLRAAIPHSGQRPCEFVIQQTSWRHRPRPRSTCDTIQSARESKTRLQSPLGEHELGATALLIFATIVPHNSFSPSLVKSRPWPSIIPPRAASNFETLTRRA